VYSFSCSKMASPRDSCAARKATAAGALTAPLASGRARVRSTWRRARAGEGVVR
jgi:hypothetical protein